MHQCNKCLTQAHINVGYDKIIWESSCQSAEGMLGILVPKRSTVRSNKGRKGIKSERGSMVHVRSRQPWNKTSQGQWRQNTETEKSGIIRVGQMTIPLQQESERALYAMNVLFFPEQKHLHSVSIT